MKTYSAEHIHNVALISHGGAGKTSLAEALLFLSGAITRLGRVEDGTTTSDYDPDEIKRHMSVSTTVVPVEWNDHKVNVLDTPGYADFFGEVVSALRVADAALVVIDTASGVQVGTELAWRRADEQSLPRAIYFNKMERENADFDRALEDCRRTFGNKVVPLAVPLGREQGFRGAIDLVTMRVYADGKTGEAADDEARAAAEKYREMLIEAVAEVDDDLITKYLEGEALSEDEIRGALRQGVASGQVVPVLCGSATHLHGVGAVGEALVNYLPTADATPMVLEDGETRPGSADGPLAALVFKTISDPYLGRLNFFRVYQGTLSSDSHVWNAQHSRDERIGQVMTMRGKQQEPAQQVPFGDIGAIAKLQETATGDTLTTKDSGIRLRGIDFPAPAYAAAIQPKTKADTDKLSAALQRIRDEDPSLHVYRDESTHEQIVAGLGETHIQIAAERMERKFGASVVIGEPRVAYRETVTTSAKAQGRHKKQTGGHGQFGDVWLEVEPLPRGGGFEFVDRVVGGAVPKNFIPAVEKGVREALSEGFLAGYPVEDVRVILYDGSSHPVDSSEMAFKIAAQLGFRKAAQDARPALLEPIMAVDITVPDEFTGDVMSDLNGKRARVLGMNPENGRTTISALVPQAEMLHYATDLRSITQGRGYYTQRLDHYDEVPAHIAQQIIQKAQKARETAAAAH
ncbi:MAG TPA: elongation factor G [Chloroflexota bacterium]|nr:elongation factor G [Chloroflexota bacterium]